MWWFWVSMLVLMIDDFSGEYIYILSLYIYIYCHCMYIHIVIYYNCSQGRFCTLFFVFLFGGVEWSVEGFPCPWWCLLLRLRCPFLHVRMRGTKERGWEGEKWNWHGWCLPIDAPTTYVKLAQCPMIFCHTASTKCLKIYPKHLLQKPPGKLYSSRESSRKLLVWGA